MVQRQWDSSGIWDILPQAMMNYLALLGWGDGTENEFFTIDQLVEKFSISRVNKSGAIFDSTKLRWMNGQHLRALPSDKLINIIGHQWKSSGILLESEDAFVKEAAELLKDGIDLVKDCDTALLNLLSYPLHHFGQGKSLFMPLRVLLTGKLHGPDMGGSIALIYKAGICGAISPEAGFVTLDERIKLLKEIDWVAFNTAEQHQEPIATASH